MHMDLTNISTTSHPDILKLYRYIEFVQPNQLDRNDTYYGMYQEYLGHDALYIIDKIINLVYDKILEIYPEAFYGDENAVRKERLYSALKAKPDVVKHIPDFISLALDICVSNYFVELVYNEASQVNTTNEYYKSISSVELANEEQFPIYKEVFMYASSEYYASADSNYETLYVIVEELIMKAIDPPDTLELDDVDAVVKALTDNHDFIDLVDRIANLVAGVPWHSLAIFDLDEKTLNMNQMSIFDISPTGLMTYHYNINDVWYGEKPNEKRAVY